MRKLNLLGQRFGRLTVTGESPRVPRHNDAQWMCKCDCGNEVTIRAGQLRSGNTVSCGCYRKELTVKRSLIDMTGQQFGKLIVIERAQGRHNKRAWWKCLCECGNETIVDGAELRMGKIKSCGCLKHLEYGEAAFNKLYYNYKNSWRRSDKDLRRSSKARLIFEINKEDFRNLVLQNCFYCGKEPDNIIKADYGDFVYNGLDRIDNTGGYMLDNVVTCCGECNFYKGTKTQEEFLSWLNRITKHIKEAK